MRVKCLLVFSLLMFAFIPNSSAQFPADNNPWEFGWETDVEPSYELMLDGEKWKIEDIVYFYVENTRMNDVTLTISVEFDSEDELLEATFNEEITVASQENETFSVELLSSNPDDVRGFSTDTSFSVKITATETAGSAEISSKEIEADLKVPARINSFQRQRHRHMQSLQELGLKRLFISTIWATLSMLRRQ